MARRPSKVDYPVGGRGPEADAAPDPSAPRLAEGNDEPRKEIIPEGYESEAEFLSYWIREYQEDAEYDEHNREEAEKDLIFTYVDQWDPEVRRAREAQGRPCVTINTLPQFIGQVIGERRMNKTSIKVIATKPENTGIAEVRTGLIKSIENFSRADRIYDACCEDQVACGISNYEITLEYSRNDVFEQDIFIRGFHNPFAVTWDRLSRDPTGRDARHCFVEDDMPIESFKEEFGIDDIPDSFPSEIESAQWTDWCDGRSVKVCALWIMVDKPATFALMDDGEVMDITDMPTEDYIDNVVLDPETGEPYIRQSFRSYAQRWLITGFTILEGPYELPLSRLPVIKVSGRVGRVGNKQYRFGIVRWAREPSEMRNYWRSVASESLAMAPRSVWLAPSASVKGREDDFREAHLTGDPLLIYNAGREKPQRVDPPMMPTAVLQEATMNAQDIKDVTGIHDASLGIRSNEVSGKAIMARQREGDVATFTYHDHLNMSIHEGGTVINELIPLAYDTTRVVRKVNIDESVEFVNINDPFDVDSPDVTRGRYDTEIITGPSFTTQRQEASEFMLETMKVMPEPMSQALDILVETQDWPGAQRLAKRFRSMIPAAQEEEAERKAQEEGQDPSAEPAEPSPEEQMAAQMEAMQAELLQAQMQAQMAELQAQVATAQAQQQKAEAEARKALAEAERAEIEVQRSEELRRREQARADEAESKAEIADDEAEFHIHERAVKLRVADNPPEGGRSSRRSGGGSRSASGSRSR
jgi:hypothetical protein